MNRRLPPAVIALSPGDLQASDCTRFLARFRRALEGGLAACLLREPLLCDRVCAELLAQLCDLAAPKGVWIGVHDRGHLVPGTPGVAALHLGFRSLTPSLARSVVGVGRALGLSTHAADPQDRWRGCDYLFLGPVLPTPSKRGLVEPIGWDGLRAGVERARAGGAGPLWAIGGLLPEHAQPARESGAAGIAVLRGILGQPDPAPAAEAYAAAWEAARP